jgi:predicted nuclease of predicted toxin-antitoxin system
MSIRLLIDMNLSPQWVQAFEDNGWRATHWSDVGNANAPDQVIMRWALDHEYVVFTHDLDFGTILAVTQAAGPSVIQVRLQDVLPGHAAEIVSAALRQFEDRLCEGALVSGRTMSTSSSERTTDSHGSTTHRLLLTKFLGLVPNFH